MIGALIVLLLAAAGGTVATYLFDEDAPGYARVATGTVIGLTILGFVAFIAALVLGLGLPALAIAVAVSLVPAIALRGDLRARVIEDVRASRTRAAAAVQRIARDRHPSLGDLGSLVYVAGLAIIWWAIADRNIFEGPDGLFITNVGNLGDFPFHTAVTTSFAYGHNFPPQNPIFSGTPFAYYYIVDFLASITIAAGATLRDGLFLVTLVLGGSLLALIHRWARDLTANAAAARLAVPLFLFSGGLGWVLLFDESRQLRNGLIGAFLGSDARYTIQPEGVLRFQNAVTGLLGPQRGILLGMGLAVIVFTLIWRRLNERPAAVVPPSDVAIARARVEWSAPMLVAGVLTGALPLVHTYAFGVVLGTAFLLAVLFREWRAGRWRDWLSYVIPALAIGLPTLFVATQGIGAGLGSYFALQIGWDSGAANPLYFWFANAGLFIPILFLAYVWDWEPPLLSRKLTLYSLAFMSWFVVANVFRLAPWIWDNIKVLIFWWLGGVPVAALFLVRIWNGRTMARVFAVFVALALMTAGALDIARSTIGPSVYREWDPDAIAFAEQVRLRTPPAAVILTDPTWNTPIYLTGRPVFMGYNGWLFSYGLPWADRDREARAMYAGGSDAKDLLATNAIEYIALGPEERRDVAPNESFLKQFPLAVEVGAYQLYQVTR